MVRLRWQFYFTDPPYGISEKERELPHNGLYRIAPDGALHLLETDFGRPNGLAFSPDESLLYVDDSPRREIRVFSVNAQGQLTSDRLFATLESPEEGSPDGMKLDVTGNIYCTGPGASGSMSRRAPSLALRWAPNVQRTWPSEMPICAPCISRHAPAYTACEPNTLACPYSSATLVLVRPLHHDASSRVGGHVRLVDSQYHQMVSRCRPPEPLHVVPVGL